MWVTATPTAILHHRPQEGHVDRHGINVYSREIEEVIYHFPA